MSSESDRAAFVNALHASTPVPTGLKGGSLPLAELLGSQAWFDARVCALRSSGGRPTDPRWDMKRTIPLTTETWVRISDLAAELGGKQRITIAPGQLASYLLEEAVDAACSVWSVRSQQDDTKWTASQEAFDDLAGDIPEDFAGWRMPGPFALCD